MKTNFKVIEHIINLDSIDDILNSSSLIDDLILEKTKKMFSNLCYDNMYILDVVRIVERSYIDLNNNTCYVKLEVMYYDVKKYDIVCNNTIITKSNDKIISNNDYFTSLIKYKPEYESLNVGDNIIIVLDKFNFLPNKPKFTVAGKLFNTNLDNNTIIYYHIDKFKNDEKDKLIEYIDNRIIPLKKQVVKHKRYSYFTKMFLDKKHDDNDATGYNLFDLETEGVIYMNNLIDLDNPLIYKVNKTHKTKANKSLGSISNPIQASKFNIYNMYLNNYYNHLNFINDLCITFEDDELLKKNLHTFKLYKLIKD